MPGFSFAGGVSDRVPRKSGCSRECLRALRGSVSGLSGLKAPQCPNKMCRESVPGVSRTLFRHSGHALGTPFGHWSRHSVSHLDFRGHSGLGASQLTTKFLTIKFSKFPKFIVMEFPKKNSVLGQFSVNLPLPNPLQNANLIDIVVSASLTVGHSSGTLRAF